jgi:hypothetical protein
MQATLSVVTAPRSTCDGEWSEGTDGGVITFQ